MQRGAAREVRTDAPNAYGQAVVVYEVETWHLLHALLAQESGIVPALVEKIGLTISALQLAAERELDRLPTVTGSVDASKVYVTQSMNEVLTRDMPVAWLYHARGVQGRSVRLEQVEMDLRGELVSVARWKRREELR
jgi:ATP-dependent Clp protease ATP-binding subunit ClpA